jgi:DNA-binding NtrC family response regulator
MKLGTPPTVLIIDDLFGREIPGQANRERENLCGKFLMEDLSTRYAGRTARIQVPSPTAKAVFFRGQSPVESNVGTVVENDLQGSLAAVRRGWTDALAKNETPWAMVLLDLCFYTGKVTEDSYRRTPGMPEGRPGDDGSRSYFGLILLDAIHREFPDLPVMLFSSKPREEVSLEFSQRGALGFIARDDARGAELLEEALWQHGLLQDPADELVGNSLAVLLALREARRSAGHRQNLLIRGERGSGKELLASYVHRISRFPNRPDKSAFVTVNSAVLTPHLFSSELFGIEPKTATGVDGKIGLIEIANGGDLFFDEIGDMPPEVQAAILRVLQERQVVRVGGRHPLNVDVRFLSATNIDLEDMSRGFRPDLLDRLRLGGSLWLPPLRDRVSDLPMLLEKFVREAEAQRPGTFRRQITADALAALSAYDWPGNIRELRGAIFDAVNRHPGVEYLVPGHLRLGQRRRAPSGSEVDPRRNGSAHLESTGVEAVLTSLSQASFTSQNVGQWAGQLGELQQEYARLISRMISAALDATKRRTPEQPEGLIQIHPAAKLITGDSTITASKAADLIKRLLGPVENELVGDLRMAYDIAVRLRPKSVNSSMGKTTKP